MRTTLLPIAAMTLVLLAGCGGDAAGPADTAAATTTTMAPAIAETVPPTDAPTTTIETTTTIAVRAIDHNKIMKEGSTYALDDPTFGVHIEFVATARSRWATVLPGYLGVSNQASGDEALMSMMDLATATVFANPLDDYDAYGRNNSALQAATVPVPGGDYLAYFSTLPGVTAGEIVDSVIFGLPARSMTFEVGELPGGKPCANGADPRPCLLTLFQGTGVTLVYSPGDAGTFSVVEIDGKQLLIEVTGDEGSEEFIAGLTLGS